MNCNYLIYDDFMSQLCNSRLFFNPEFPGLRDKNAAAIPGFGIIPALQSLVPTRYSEFPGQG